MKTAFNSMNLDEGSRGVIFAAVVARVKSLSLVGDSNEGQACTR